MKCIFCDSENIRPAKDEGFYGCPICGFLYDKEPLADYGKKKPKTKFAFIKSKDFNPKVVFEKARSKFDKGKWSVVAIKLNKDKMPSLLFGQEFIVLLRKN